MKRAHAYSIASRTPAICWVLAWSSRFRACPSTLSRSSSSCAGGSRRTAPWSSSNWNMPKITAGLRCAKAREFSNSASVADRLSGRREAARSSSTGPTRSTSVGVERRRSTPAQLRITAVGSRSSSCPTTARAKAFGRPCSSRQVSSRIRSPHRSGIGRSQPRSSVWKSPAGTIRCSNCSTSETDNPDSPAALSRIATSPERTGAHAA